MDIDYNLKFTGKNWRQKIRLPCLFFFSQPILFWPAGYWSIESSKQASSKCGSRVDTGRVTPSARRGAFPTARCIANELVIVPRLGLLPQTLAHGVRGIP